MSKQSQKATPDQLISCNEANLNLGIRVLLQFIALNFFCYAAADEIDRAKYGENTIRLVMVALSYCVLIWRYAINILYYDPSKKQPFSRMAALSLQDTADRCIFVYSILSLLTPAPKTIRNMLLAFISLSSLTSFSLHSIDAHYNMRLRPGMRYLLLLLDRCLIQCSIPATHKNLPYTLQQIHGMAVNTSAMTLAFSSFSYFLNQSSALTCLQMLVNTGASLIMMTRSSKKWLWTGVASIFATMAARSRWQNESCSVLLLCACGASLLSTITPKQGSNERQLVNTDQPRLSVLH